jgi:HPt (histidine-containing phosphotransfer) domain-containing protein
VEQTSEMLEKSRGALAEGDKTLAASAFHKISGGAYALRANELAERALAAERILKDGDATQDAEEECEAETWKAFERLKETIKGNDWSTE